MSTPVIIDSLRVNDINNVSFSNFINQTLSLTGSNIYVEDFGAVGDGVTDDTTAIQSAIDFCAYRSRGTNNAYYNLHLKSSKYKITAPIHLK